MRRYLSIGFLLLVFLVPLHSFAQENNAGFVQGLWYSTDVAHIFVGKSVRMYVAVRNNTGSDLSGTVTFLDGDKQISQKTVQAIDGHIIETWADWDPTYGTHTISANLSRVELSAVGSSTQSVTITSGLAQDTFFVDYDTDSDGIGNRVDIDDDGDGIPDSTEIAQGTDPLVPNKTTMVLTNPVLPQTTPEANPIISRPASTSIAASSSPEGLEQFIPEGMAQDTVAQMTQLITETKQSLDTYRAKRDQQLYDQTHQQNVTVNAQGFGPITRSAAPDKNKIQLPKLTGSSTLDKALSGAKLFGSLLYTWFLNALSFALSKPMFIQILLMILILFTLFKLAARFGRRRNKLI